MLAVFPLNYGFIKPKSLLAVSIIFICIFLLVIQISIAVDFSNQGPSDTDLESIREDKLDFDTQRLISPSIMPIRLQEFHHLPPAENVMRLIKAQ